MLDRKIQEGQKRKTMYKEKVTRKRNKGKTTLIKLTKTEPKDDDYNDLSPLFDSQAVNFPSISLIFSKVCVMGGSITGSLFSATFVFFRGLIQERHPLHYFQ